MSRLIDSPDIAVHRVSRSVGLEVVYDTPISTVPERVVVRRAIFVFQGSTQIAGPFPVKPVILLWSELTSAMKAQLGAIDTAADTKEALG